MIARSKHNGERDVMRRVAAWAGCSILAFAPVVVEAAVPTLRVGYDSWVGHAGIFIAQAKGFFQRRGVRIELRAFPGPTDTIAPTIAGDLDIALTTPDTVLSVNANQKTDLINVAFIDASTGADAVVVRENIKDIAALRNRKIAVTFGQCNELLLLEALASAGLRETDVHLINMDADASGAALVAGSLDAAVTWEPWVSRITSSGRGHVVFSSKDAPDVIFDSVAVRSAFAATHPQQIEAFIRGVSDGVSYLRAYPVEGEAIVAQMLSSRPADVAVMLKGVSVFDLRDNLVLFGDSTKPGRIYAAMDKVADFQVAHHLYQSKSSTRATLVPTYVMGAQAVAQVAQ
jgi:NitT/TauT family transport system substrate-binding protein